MKYIYTFGCGKKLFFPVEKLKRICCLKLFNKLLIVCFFSAGMALNNMMNSELPPGVIQSDLEVFRRARDKASDVRCCYHILKLTVCTVLPLLVYGVTVYFTLDIVI